MKLRSLLLGVAVTLHLILAQNVNPPGFISLDCGLLEINGYHDSVIGLPYTSDEGFIEAGESKRISPELVTESVSKQFLNVRSFPNGSRNCYTFRPLKGKGSQILVRVGFMYGNYDNENKVPEFDLQLGVDHWDTLTFHNSSSVVYVEIIHTLESEYLHVCLLNTGRGTPFISVLELRPLDDIYDTSLGSLHLIARGNLGSTTQAVRYKDGDTYDRIWSEAKVGNTNPLRSSNRGLSGNNRLKVGDEVMATAAEAVTINHSVIISVVANASHGVYFYLHFAELLTNQSQSQSQSREMEIYLNAHLLSRYQPRYLCVDTFHAVTAHSSTSYELEIKASSNSSLPPILNAAEFYALRKFTSFQTNKTHVAAILSIKAKYAITKNWQGDPCSPPSFAWIGITCSYTHSQPPNIISLNLSGSGLVGTIAAAISNLTMLQYLDLSYNNLTGEVPDFLHRLPSLRYLDYSYNNLTGKMYDFQLGLPSILRYSYLEEDLLSISLAPESSSPAPAPAIEPSTPAPAPGKSRKDVPSSGGKNVVVPIAAALGAAFVVVLIVAALSYIIIRRKSGSDPLVEPNLRQCTFSEIESMIRGNTVIGEGGFGIVYRGLMNGVQVAVKILKPSVQLDITTDFKSEVKILARIHHKNLIRILGYCNEGMHRAIIFELLENGNLKSHLSESSPTVLSWDLRLSIMSAAAQGLEYMHHGCPEPIVHRDIKPENILLTENFEAKLADFGLSRIFPAQMSREVGTLGYYNNEYSEEGMLTLKADLYSFGVVMLVVVTGQPAIKQGTHITQWVCAKIRNGDIRGIVDPRLEGNYDHNVAWKVVELGMACVSTITSRPNMHHVVRELNECLHNATQGSGPSNYTNILPTMISPAPR